jgi:hypothetical protein
MCKGCQRVSWHEMCLGEMLKILQEGLRDFAEVWREEGKTWWKERNKYW